MIRQSFEYSLAEEQERCMQNYISICNAIKIAGDRTDSRYIGIMDNILDEIKGNLSKEYVYLQLYDTKENVVIFHDGTEIMEEEPDYESGSTSVMAYTWKHKSGYYYRIMGGITVIPGSEYEEKESYVLCAAYEITSVYKLRDSEIKLYKKLMIVFNLIGAVIAFFISLWLTSPLEKLTKSVRKIAEGDISHRAEIHSGDEIEMLSGDINVMADRIESDMGKLKDSASKQEIFMGNFAHEMKTPMTSIIGYADLLRSHEMNPEEIRESANYIFSEGRRLENLSLKMLELIVLNNEQLELKPHNPANVIFEAVKMVRYSLKEKDIRIDEACDPSLIMLDKDLFKSLMINLIDNAAKSIDENGVIEVTARQQSDRYIIQIKDNGRGMTQEELEKISDAFYRADKSRSRAQGGAGLGLSICKKIAELHGAKLSYTSVYGEGTCVEISVKNQGELHESIQ